MYGNKDKIKDLAIFAVDTICLMVSYILANCLWLKVYKGFKTISRTDLMDELGLVLFAFLGTILFFNVNRLIFLISSLHIGKLLNAPGASGVPEVDKHHILVL